MKIEMGLGWVPSEEKPGHIRTANPGEYAAEIVRLREELEDAEADALRLHRDKMAYFEAAIALVHSETIKNVCGWYPEIEAFRKLLGMAAPSVTNPADVA